MKTGSFDSLFNFSSPQVTDIDWMERRKMNLIKLHDFEREKNPNTPFDQNSLAMIFTVGKWRKNFHSMKIEPK